MRLRPSLCDLFVQQKARAAVLRALDLNAAMAVGYSSKSLRRMRFVFDDLLVLARAMNEVQDCACPAGPRFKDWPRWC